MANFLRTAKTAIDGEAPKLRTWAGELKRRHGDACGMDPAFAQRNVNEGFSGGEKKRHEIVQLELLQPKIAILDETDSGLDIDALRVVSEGVNRVRETGETGILLITHYTRILRYIKPDFVHVFVGGRIVEEGGPELAEQLEAEGYERYLAGAGTGARRSHRGHADDDGACDVDDGPRGLPDPGPRGQRAPAGLPRLRQHLAEAAPGDRRGARALRAAQRQRGPVGAHARHRGDRGVRGRPGEGGARSSARPPPDEVVFTKNSTEAINLVALRLPRRQPGATATRGSGSGPATRSSSPRWSTTPTSCRGSCSASAPARRCAGSASPTTAGSTCPTLDELINERTKLVSVVHYSNILGTINPIDAASSPGPAQVGALVHARRLPVGAAPAGRRGRRWAWTSSRSPATRCAARPASACCGGGRSCSRRCRRSSAAAR